MRYFRNSCAGAVAGAHMGNKLLRSSKMLSLVLKLFDVEVAIKFHLNICSLPNYILKLVLLSTILCK